jgi:hypothetical protein
MIFEISLVYTSFAQISIHGNSKKEYWSLVVVVSGVQCGTCFRYCNTLGMVDVDFAFSMHCVRKSIRYNVKK